MAACIVYHFLMTWPYDPYSTFPISEHHGKSKTARPMSGQINQIKLKKFSVSKIGFFHVYIIIVIMFY